VGISGSFHPDQDSVMLLVFAKGFLNNGQNEKINVTVTDRVPQQVMQQMKHMGIDTNRIKVIEDTD